LDAQFVENALAITDNERLPQFFQTIDDWPRSNPRGYAEWFKVRMGDEFNKRREQVLKEMRADKITASIEDIPTYRIRTPLQSAIMILKRHRDKMFSDNPEIKPISIIISTLSAHAYHGEPTIGYALLSILDRMEDGIERDGQKWIIKNPTDVLENFADKWETNPERAEAFYAWLSQAREDFAAAGILVEHRLMSNGLASRMGQNVTDQASESIARPSKLGAPGLLGAASAASSTSAPSVSFADTPRTPKKPDGFA